MGPPSSWEAEAPSALTFETRVVFGGGVLARGVAQFLLIRAGQAGAGKQRGRRAATHSSSKRQRAAGVVSACAHLLSVSHITRDAAHAAAQITQITRAAAAAHRQ